MATGPIKAGVTRTVLYVTNNKTTTDFDLADDYTKYDYLMFEVQSNYEFWDHLVDVDRFRTLTGNYAMSFEHSGTPTEGGFVYNANISVQPSSTTRIHVVSAGYNNVNWKVGIRRVLGIKLH